MRFIHTADWHLGNLMHDIDRRTEAESFLKWLKSQITEKNAESLIVAGDIFDTVNPSVEARRLYYTFLASLVDSCCKNVIIVGGNHDSAVMLDSAKELLELLNIRVVGSINNLSPADMCFELKNTAGEVSGICMAVPFVRELELRNLVADASVPDADLYALSYKRLYDSVFAAAQTLRAGRTLPVIATGHLYAGSVEGRLSQKKSNEKSDDGTKVLDVLGTLGAVPPSVFPPVDYVALGHIHYSSMVGKNPAVRYSGSPFVMGFDEASIAHGLLLVDVESSHENEIPSLRVEKILSPSFYRYERISGTISEIKARLENFSARDEKPTFLEICYKRELGVNAHDYLDAAIRALPKTVSVVSWKVADSGAFFSSGSPAHFDAGEIKNLDDKEIFTQLILSKSSLDAESQEGKAAVEKFLPLFLKIASE